MRFSDFLLVSDPADLDYIVGYAGDQNIRIDVADFVADYISGSGTPGYVPVFTAANVIGDSVVFQHGTNIVIGGVNSLGYKLAVSGSLYASNGAVINSTVSGADALRVIGGDGDIFVIPNDLGQPISSLRRINHPPAVLTTESATLGQLNSAISNLEEDIDILLDLKVDKTSVGAANGVASLDAGGKVPLSQIPDSIIGQVQYMGTWNALTNTPTLNFLVPEEKGHYYVVSVAGVFGGIDFQVGDWIISNGTYWEKVDNTDAVTSVFGRIGAILALEADYQSFYPRLSQAYDNPTWINTLAFSKITGVPPFLLENQTITLSGDVTGSGKTSISTTISDNAVTDSKLRNSVGTSVIGRASSTTGDPADIQATTDGHVLLRSGGNLLFGLISSDSIGSIDWSKITNTPTTLSGYGITNAYTKTEADNKFVPYTGANANVNLGSNNITANSFIKAGGTSAQFLKADGSVDTSQYVPTTRSINAGTGLTGGGNLSSDVNIAFDTTWGDTRYAYRTRQLTINGTTYDLSADRIWNVGTVTSVGLSMPSAFTVSNSPVIGAGVLTVVGAGTILEYVRGDGSLATFPSLTGYVPYTGATQDVNLGTYGLIGDFVRFNPSSSNIPSAEGVMWWDNTDGTVRLSVKGNTYSVPIGQSVISRVRNSTGGNLLRTNYQVVKVAGAQGQRLAVSLAQANNDLNSASTLGLVCEDISNNQEGFIVNIGQIVNVNTTGNLQGETWLDGDVLYLSPTIAGAITNIKPVAPQHTVILGYVEYAHANNGKIYVKIDNGYELEELHDVSAEPFINNGLLYRDTTLNLWKSATISTILGYTPAPQGNYITSLTGEATASGPGAASVTLSNSAVTGKVLTGLNIAGNEILSTDSILTAFGKLQHQVNQLVGGLQYEGTWNASTNTPTITSSVGTDGTFYIVSVAGTTNINGITDWQVGDWIVFHDTAWQKVDNSDSVSSVFGRVGNIVANQADYSAFYPLIADIKNGVLTVQGTGVLSGSGTFSANQATNNTISLIHSAISRTDTTSTQTPSFGGSFNVIDSVTSSAEGHITAIDTKTVTIPSTVASASQTGLLSSADWSTFNGKQNAITLTTTGTSGPATLVGATLNIPNYAPDLSGYVTLGTDQTITGLKTIVRSGDVLNFKIGTDTLYGLKVAYNQNELVPSGEATWSFVNTFNRNGVGYETTPISFFRGVLVTGERLLSASINSNLLDYYGNNPSGRYPVYAYNTGVQQFSTGIIVGKTTGVVNAATGAIADLPSGVVANFNGRVIGGSAVNSNEFVTLSQLGSYVPTSRTLTINGVSYDLSDDRSWTIAGGVTSVSAGTGISVNQTTGAVTVTNTGVLSVNGSAGVITGIATTAQLANYLPLTGGTLTGALTIGTSVNSVIWNDGTGTYIENTGNTSSSRKIRLQAHNGSFSYTQLFIDGAGGFVEATNQMRAPIFYDSNNTAYYVDAASTSNIYRLAMNERITLGVFPNSTTNTGEAWIGRAADRNSGTMTVQLGGNSPSSRQFEVVDYAWSVVLFSTTSDGNSIASSSFRAPIFYDSNNTAYYIDGASTSDLNALKLNALFLDRNEGAARGISWYASSFTAWAQYMASAGQTGCGPTGNITAPSGTLVTTWALRSFVENEPNYGWTFESGSSSGQPSVVAEIRSSDGSARFYGAVTTTNVNAPSGYISFGNPWGTSNSAFFPNGITTAGGTNWIYGSTTYIGNAPANGAGHEFFSSGSSYSTGNMEAGSSMRAPIFYDRNDTGYYADFNSTSSTAIRLRGGMLVGPNTTWGAYLQVGGNGHVSASYANVVTTDGNLHLDPASTKAMYLNYYVNGIIYLNGTTYSISSNGSYYNGRSANSDAVGGFGAGTFFRDLGFEGGGSNANTIVETRSAFTYGVGAPHTGPLAYFGAGGYGLQLNATYIAGNSMSFRTKNGDNGTWNTWREFIHSGNIASQTAGNTNSISSAVGGNYTWTGLNYFRSNRNTSSDSPPLQAFSDNGSGAIMSFHRGGYYAVNFGLDSDNVMRIGGWSANPNRWQLDMSGNNWVAGSSRAPIFYDSDDTGYYLNPNGLSNLDKLELSGGAYFRPRNWVQLDGAYGLYWPNNYGAHFYPNNGSSYTQLRIDGNKNGYGGIWDSYSAVAGMMYDGNGNGGVYRESNGRWFWYYLLSSDCMGIGTSTTSPNYSLYLNKGVFAQSRIDATIYYDSANTAYYLDPNGTSYLASSLEIASGYVLTNGVGGAIFMSSSQGSFGGYVRFAQHAVIESINGGYHIYVLDASGVGVVKYSGSQSWSAYSDGTIKTVHSVMEDNLSKLESITPIYYSFNNFADDKNRIGLIAQEVQEHFPELVATDPKTEKLTLDYTGLIPVLLGAIKELKTEIETLKTQL